MRSGCQVASLAASGLADPELAMDLCAVDFPPDVSEIDMAKLELLASECVQARRIASSPAQLECRRLITLQPGRERYSSWARCSG